eukprot:403366080
MKADAAKQQQYDVSHILVKDQKTANDIEAQLKKGANFADLAKKYSTDPGSKANGGELGWSIYYYSSQDSIWLPYYQTQ